MGRGGVGSLSDLEIRKYIITLFKEFIKQIQFLTNEKFNRNNFV